MPAWHAVPVGHSYPIKTCNLITVRLLLEPIDNTCAYIMYYLLSCILITTFLCAMFIYGTFLGN